MKEHTASHMKGKKFYIFNFLSLCARCRAQVVAVEWPIPPLPTFLPGGSPLRKPQKKVLCVGVGETESSSGSGGKGFPPRSGKRCVLSPPCLSTSAFVQTHSRPFHIHSPSRIKKPVYPLANIRGFSPTKTLSAK